MTCGRPDGVADQWNDALSIRAAGPTDAGEVARLHADSWRRHYRFAYPAEFFGATLDRDRAATWRRRLSGGGDTRTFVAVIGDATVGFVHVAMGDDPQWGALVDNLHVRHDVQRRGVGRALLHHAATSVAAAGGRGARMHLWVLEHNERARAFYRSVGGRELEHRPVEPPALPHVDKIRCVWTSAADLIGATIER